MSEIMSLSYDSGGALNLTMYDPNANETSDITAVDVETTNMLAVDSAFERQTPVRIDVDEHKHIIRVGTLGRAPNQPEPDPTAPGYAISRIATQRQENLIAEVFLLKDPTSPEETPSRTADPLMHVLCHGAFLSKRRLQMTVDKQHIKRVVKRRLDAQPSVAVSQ